MANDWNSIPNGWMPPAWLSPHSPAYWQQNQANGWAQPYAGSMVPPLQFGNPMQATPQSIAAMYAPTPPGYMGAPVAGGAQPQAVPLGFGQMTQPAATMAAPGLSGRYTPEPGLLGNGQVMSPMPMMGTPAANPMGAPAMGPPQQFSPEPGFFSSPGNPAAVTAPLSADVTAKTIPITPKTPGVAVPTPAEQQAQFAQNLGLAQTIIGGVNTLGQLGMGAYQLWKSADAYDFQKNLALKNLQNQTKSYNTAMDDKVRGAHGNTYNQTHKAELDAQITGRSLTDKFNP